MKTLKSHSHVDVVAVLVSMLGGAFETISNLQKSYKDSTKNTFSLNYLVQTYAQSPPNTLMPVSYKQRHSPTQQQNQ